MVCDRSIFHPELDILVEAEHLHKHIGRLKEEMPDVYTPRKA
jgi:hypothetical protein